MLGEEIKRTTDESKKLIKQIRRHVTINKLVACMEEYLSGPIQKPTSKFLV